MKLSKHISPYNKTDCIDIMKYYRLVYMSKSDKTIGVYTNIDDLFKDAQAYPAHESELQVHEMNIESPGADTRSVFGSDTFYSFAWNKCALFKETTQANKGFEIAYVAKGYDTKMDAIVSINHQMNELKAKVEDKIRMVKSLMNLDAKQTKAPISMAAVLGSFVSFGSYTNSSKQVDAETYNKNKQDELERVRYLNALLDDWITDLKAQTGYEGLLHDLITTNTWGGRVEAITYP